MAEAIRRGGQRVVENAKRFSTLLTQRAVAH
ncbi:hypothetical protein AvCA_04930 [Azotobacter vinelandii CA]|uniref:Uncharacterized protein n=2 Tax=Azotobacter vinelandii TaxID=354 RepID=C1DJG2_AZOVD|nr:hypothetical protein Avin_04930 [Azotobacter vinelandii DJ]AGK15591.1 hypothetical protein AvCA_04930 [Azotobacter vinelandii CA]AGK19337.1 hypothetical protein AvCA6_04930 [Azotobacter vinelandii CA6]